MGTEVTSEAQLAKLREVCAGCPGCRFGEVEDVADEHLPQWLRAHGIDPDTLEPGTEEQRAAWRKSIGFVIGGQPT